MTDKQCYNQNKKTISWLNNYKIGSGREENFNVAIEALKRANEVLKGRPNGKWIDTRNFPVRWTCSECGRRDTHIYKFCPDCGAKMR